MCVGRHAQITQNNKFAISLQYLKKEVSDVDFLQADRQESVLQIDTMIFIGDDQSSQNSKFVISLQYLKKRSDEVDSLHADKNHKGDTVIIDGHGQAGS